MKTMKTNLKFLAIILSIGFFMQSCSNDDDGSGVSGPEITDFEYGEGSDHSTDPFAYKGSDLHVEADIYAEAIVSSIKLSIHSHDIEPEEGEVVWDLDTVYTSTNYMVMNPSFHEHIDIPADAAAGEYHIELTVEDEDGNSTTSEGHLEILSPITLSDIEIDETVQRGNEIHAEFFIDAPLGVHNITVDIHSHGLPLEEGDVEWDYEGVFEDGYHGETAVEFHGHIDVPATAPVGEYHATFTVEDEDGNTLVYETHIDITA